MFKEMRKENFSEWEKNENKIPLKKSNFKRHFNKFFEFYSSILKKEGMCQIKRFFSNHCLFLTDAKFIFQIIPIKGRLPFGVFWDQKTLPSAWSLKDRWNWLDKRKRFDWGDLELSPCNLQVTYRGLGRSDEDAASIRSNKTIPIFLPLFYYEIKIISIGKFGYIGIGLCCSHVDLDRLPGWEKDSLGYHGDDGHAFRDSGTGIPYGPSFWSEDVIGMCMNQMEKKIFFTINGDPLPAIFGDVFDRDSFPVLPMVGLRTLGESVTINFGKKLFEFDLNSYSQSLFHKTTGKIFSLGKFSKITPESSKNENFILNASVSSNQEPSDEFCELRNRLYIINELLEKTHTRSIRKLIGYFWAEEDILFLKNRSMCNTFFFEIFDLFIELILILLVVSRLSRLFGNPRGTIDKKIKKLYTSFPGIFGIDHVKKMLKFELFEKLTKKAFSEGLLNFCSENKTNLYHQRSRVTGTFSEIFLIKMGIKKHSSLDFIIRSVKITLLSLKSKNPKKFSIIFLEPLNFLTFFSFLLKWFN